MIASHPIGFEPRNEPFPNGKIVKEKYPRFAQSFFLTIFPLINDSAIPGSKSDVRDETI